MKADAIYEALLAGNRVLPTDYADYGGTIVRWADKAQSYPDCSYGCRWAAWLRGASGNDWCVCARRDAPRFGLLTFEHQAGHGCFEERPKRSDRRASSEEART